jgi:hypothetical protein
VVVDNFLAAEESDALARYYDEALKELVAARLLRGRSRSWCFWKWNGCETTELVQGVERRVPGDTPAPDRSSQPCQGPSSRAWLKMLQQKHGLKPRRGTLRQEPHRVCVEDAGFDEAILKRRALGYSSSMIAPADLLDAVGHRIELEAGLPIINSNDVQLLHYGNGSSYLAHKDCKNRDRNDRVWSALVYLNNPADDGASAPEVATGDFSEGSPTLATAPSGGTAFPRLNISIVPQRGRLVLWRNVYPEKGGGGGVYCHPYSEHLSLPVRGENVKYAVQIWYHERPLVPTERHAAVPKFRPRTGFWHYSPDGNVSVAEAASGKDAQHYVQCDPSKSCREYMNFGNMQEPLRATLTPRNSNND